MALFVRLEIGFWTHRKTLRLRAAIGDSALWVPPRLWSYAAEHQPDGDFSGYSAEEIAMLIGYIGNAQAMLGALQNVCFMDEMKLHGWDERNAYHKTFSERAKKAADARWSGNRKGDEKKMRREEKRQALLVDAKSNASSINDSFSEFWKEYPRRVGRANAEKAWEKLECEKLLLKILAAVRSCKVSFDWTKESGQYIPYPATWLNRCGWEDELFGAAVATPAPGFAKAYDAPRCGL